MNFQELIEFKNKEEQEASAYVIGAEDYYEEKEDNNPFDFNSSAYKDYEAGWSDAEFLSLGINFERN